jgi:hypothetical protein
MTVLTSTCPACQGKGWVRSGPWPTECGECTPTKKHGARVIVDAKRVSAILQRREADKQAQVRRGFIPVPPFVDDAQRIYDYD